MYQENGKWYLNCTTKNDKTRLKNIKDLENLIKKVGFLPIFSNDIPLFSVEEKTLIEDWWSGDFKKDPWIWREILCENENIAYGKFFDKKAGFISKEFFPDFSNFKRNGYDFDAAYEDGLENKKEKLIMDLFLPDKKEVCDIKEEDYIEFLSCDIKKKANFSKTGESNFEGTISLLQTKSYLLTSSFRQRKNKKGEDYGWNIAVLTMPEMKFGYDFVSSAYQRTPLESFEIVKDKIKENFDATDEQIRKIFK